MTIGRVPSTGGAKYLVIAACGLALTVIAVHAQVRDVDLWGVVIVELDDGTRVEAGIDHALAQELKGGDTLLIERADTR